MMGKLLSVMIFFGSLAGICLLGVVLSSGASAEQQGSGNVKAFSAERRLEVGTVVELVDTNKVVPVSAMKAKDSFGVVVDSGELSVIVIDSGLKNETFVATSGSYRALVSLQNGPIQKGDYVTVSALDGVLMKADTKQETVFGRAIGKFDDNSVTAGTAKLKGSNGTPDRTVKLGLASITIDIKKNPNIDSTKSKMPEFLEDIGQQIAKKEVSPVRIYLSLAITAISLITAIVVLYSGVKNGVVSIGRNPMSKKSIFRALLEIILTSIAVLMVGLFAVYLLLRL